MATNEVLKEESMVEYSQKASQDIEVQTIGSMKKETTEGEPSQRERTLRRSDKGKEVAKHTPSSSRGRPSVQRVSRWLRKEIMRNRKAQFDVDEEDIIELAEVLNKLESPSQEAREFPFINSSQDQYFFSQVDIPPG